MVIRVKLTDVPEEGIIEPHTEGSPVFLARVQGTLTALDSTCTHAGCNVAFGEVSGKIVTCPCHGSEFDLLTGEVVRGPAARPLLKHTVKVDGDTVLIE